MQINKEIVPLFIKGHPLKMWSHLLSKEFNPVFYMENKTTIANGASKTVYILTSLTELPKFIKSASEVGIKKLRIAAFTSPNELKAFQAWSLLFKIHYRKKDILSFIPYNVILPYLEGLNVQFGSNQTDNVVSDLDKAMELSKLIKTEGNKNGRRTKRKSK